MLSIVVLAPLARIAPPAPALLLRAAGWLLAVAIGAFVSALPANAEDAVPRIDAGVVEQVRGLAASRLAEAGAPRVEVLVGQLDPRLRLAPCERIEPYLPPNVKLWGRSRVGLRCKQGPTPWNVYLPVTVKVWAKALVVPAGAAAGSVLADADLHEAEVDLAEEHTAAIVDRRLVVGRTLAQALKPGQAVRQGHVKLRQWFAAGDTVRVVVAGAGYALESEGQALTHGIEGQPARVRTESGRVVSGQPSGERRLEVTL
ncbi:MAG TPA: flagellar basal body P-ring formation chaperone FlgA [Caldimonas sp.]|jgi:flagella basal body P-ring formation protein FlgA|nr:flagellar basal body P-ring formation chaperone FlgA [Caldimonas sp.]HEX2539844.1 flagellar basal body P-ring formation chaperone FlgA [Caldimonas sp.]